MFKLVWIITFSLLVCTQSWASEQAKDAHETDKAQEKKQTEKPKVTEAQDVKPSPKREMALNLNALLISLLQVQDRIARGDEAALKLQKHLMKLLDAGIAEHGSDWNVTPPQFRALVIFGIVGTGSNSVLGALRQVREPSSDAQLAKAVLFYRNRQRERATEEFSKIKMEGLDARLIPFVAFARGNLMALSKPGKAITSYNITRLTAPGTLLEETSLRRLMMLYSSQNNGKKFISVAKQYARRFIKSPYRNQYLKMLRAGIFTMRQTISLDDVGALADLMPQNYAVALQMHLLHQAVISGYTKLAEYSIGRLNLLLEANPEIKLDGTKLALLKLLSRMRHDNPAELLSELEAFDQSTLNADDQKLYAAAADILNAILSPVDQKVLDGVVLEEKSEDERKSSDEVEEVSSGPTQADKMHTSGTEDSIEDFIVRTQEKLSQIDVMLSN